jgi:flagellin
MPVSIVSNSSAIFARDSVAQRSTELAMNTNRLSSGQRVMSAEDDASALVIGNGLRMQIAAYRTAQINASGGISLAQVADGALNELTDILVRMQSLSVQSRSEQISDNERSILNTEYQSLLSEIDRVAADTTFNGVSLLTGSTTTVSELNALGGNSLVSTAAGISSISFEDSVGDGMFQFSYTAATNTFTAENLENGAISNVIISPDAIGAGSTETVPIGGMGIQVVLNENFNKAVDMAGADSASIVGGTGAIDNTTIQLGTFVLDNTNPLEGADIDARDIAMNVTVPGASVLSIDLNGTTFTSAGVDLTSAGVKIATLTDGAGNSFQVSFEVTNAFDGAETASITMAELGQLAGSESTPLSYKEFDFQVGTSVDGSDRVNVRIDAIRIVDLGLTGTAVTNREEATSAITQIDAALSRVNNVRAQLGAAMQRLEFASSSLAVSIENAESTRSSLLDVDVSSEITELTQSQALLEAGISMLAQANLRPNILLGLLRNGG